MAGGGGGRLCISSIQSISDSLTQILNFEFALVNLVFGFNRDTGGARRPPFKNYFFFNSKAMIAVERTSPHVLKNNTLFIYTKIYSI